MKENLYLIVRRMQDWEWDESWEEGAWEMKKPRLREMTVSKNRKNTTKGERTMLCVVRVREKRCVCEWKGFVTKVCVMGLFFKKKKHLKSCCWTNWEFVGITAPRSGKYQIQFMIWYFTDICWTSFFVPRQTYCIF